MARDPAEFHTLLLTVLATTDNEPQLVAVASLSDVRIRLAVFGTSNKRAFFSTRQNDVRDPGGTATTPTGFGNCFVVTVGDRDTIYLSRGQSLYAIADGTGVYATWNSVGAEAME
jgi:hypothetical protein